MKPLAELIPIVLFFTVYKFSGSVVSIGEWHYQLDGIYSATLVLMIATTIQIVATRLLTGRLESRQMLLLAAVLVFGTATLVFRNQLFIQWKPTVFNWTLVLIFLGTHAVTGRTVMERALAKQITLPAHIWKRLNWLWIANFAAVGALNLVVAYNFSEATWVSYKMYSSIGFTLLLSGLTVLLMMPHLRDTVKDGSDQTS